ncbi:outer membrane beta-barrel protein [Aliiroseovarius subalbicans]|uniref:outer membrane protein n=1 Tax=Aliiroseovarius subalbicans TaxID=2925840 RepID=UPI001F5A561C|nr:outer membrane beta-barrel protein [Aliiroseovarius subalbicans]MCI2401168.1 outer membrane beta-barrel protein [Aliiroseovarius subalbicans]
MRMVGLPAVAMLGWGALFGTAIAGSYTPNDPVAVDAQPFSWAGAYLGAHIDGQFSNIEVDGATDGGTVFSSRPGGGGVFGGIYAGYNWERTPNTIVGIDVEYNWGSVDGSDALSGIADRFFNTSINETAAIRGRIGRVVNNSLFYVSAGVAALNYDLDVHRASGFIYGETHNRIGWTLGVGFEQKLSGKWVGRVDYRYSDFGEGNDYSDSFGTTAASKIKTNDLRFGIASSF